LLLDVQSPLLASLTSRVVIPLCPASAIAGDRIKTLMPVFDIAGQRYFMHTPQLAGIAKRQLGGPVADITIIPNYARFAGYAKDVDYPCGGIRRHSGDLAPHAPRPLSGDYG
jgi:hypothetical protein